MLRGIVIAGVGGGEKVLIIIIMLKKKMMISNSNSHREMAHPPTAAAAIKYHINYSNHQHLNHDNADQSSCINYVS